MDQKIKVGVVGVGALGIHHVRIWKELENSSQVQLVGIYDIDPERARAVADKFRCHIFSSLKEVAQSCEAASIVTPTATHYEIASFLIDSGVHLLIEKPITADRKQAEDLIRQAAQKGCIIQVGHVERFNPVYRYLTQAVPNPVFIEVHRLSPFPKRSTDIGVILDLMIHDLDIVMSLVKAGLQSYEAVGVPVLTESEDIANVRLRFANGCVANLTASRISTEKIRKIRVFAAGPPPCYVSLDYVSQSGYMYRLVDSDMPESPLWKKLLQGERTAIVSSFGTRKIVREPVPISPKEPLRLELEHFLSCLLTHQTPETSGTAAKRALDLALDLTQQVRERYIRGERLGC